MQEGDFSVIDWEKDGHIDHAWYTHERSWASSTKEEIYLTYHTANRYKRSVSSILAQISADYGTIGWWYTQDSARLSGAV